MEMGSMRVAGTALISGFPARYPVHRVHGLIGGSRRSTPPAVWHEEAGRAELEVEPVGAPVERSVGDTLEVRVLFRGDAVSGGHVSVIPHGRTLPPFGSPNRWDLVTDEQGVARYEISEPGLHLVFAHLQARDQEESLVPHAAAFAVLVKAGSS